MVALDVPPPWSAEERVEAREQQVALVIQAVYLLIGPVDGVPVGGRESRRVVIVPTS